MPLIEKSTYPGPPWYQYNGHLQTILPSSFRRINLPRPKVERLELPDGDFLDLDWYNSASNELVILTHGLEGHSQRSYVLGMAKFFFDQHWDVLAWNCRSCSGEMNRTFRLYYHGDIEDIGYVIDRALEEKKYKRIVLVGFSMGGNITLKYLGVHGKNIPVEISHGIAFSTPSDLKACIEVINKKENRFYSWFFFKALKAKIKAKAKQYPDRIDLNQLSKVKDWYTFDKLYSAPLNGFNNTEKFYYEASSKNFMTGTQVPTLLVNAANDPMLDERSSPSELAKSHPKLHIEIAKEGGHVGFAIPNKNYSWAELRAWEFCHNT